MAETRLLEGGRLAAAFVTRAALAETGSRREDAEGFVEQLRRLAGVRVALLLREEEKDGKVFTKASLRSSGNDSVRDVAAQFGGGGHKNAAGATIAMDAGKTLDALLPHICSIWN
jgi:phosphoesterase RecJ-like protein